MALRPYSERRVGQSSKQREIIVQNQLKRYVHELVELFGGVPQPSWSTHVRQPNGHSAAVSSAEILAFFDSNEREQARCLTQPVWRPARLVELPFRGAGSLP